MFGFGYSHLDIVFVLGGPGSGKGTLCNKLTTTYPEIQHISVGDLCRAEIKRDSRLGKRIAKCVEEGKLVDMKTVVALVKTEIRARKYQGKKCFLVDGMPRDLPQIARFEGKVAAPKTVLFIDCSVDVMESRLQVRADTGERSEDADADVVKTRLHDYDELTTPVVEYYKEQDKVVRLDGNGESDAVYDEAVTRLGEIIDLEAFKVQVIADENT